MQYKDIDAMIESMTVEQIKSVMATLKQKGNVRRIDMSRRKDKLAMNDLYFSSAPKPHMCDNFETYKQHSDSIREQVLSGVDICQKS